MSPTIACASDSSAGRSAALAPRWRDARIWRIRARCPELPGHLHRWDRDTPRRRGRRAWIDRRLDLPPRIAEVLARSAFQERLQSPKIGHVGLVHRSSHDRRRDRSETRGLPPIAESHPGRAVRLALPGVRRLHGERALRGCHHEAAPRLELPDFVCVLQRPAEELGAEPDPGTDDYRRRGVPPDRLDVLVPGRRIRRIGGKAETSSRGRLILISVTTSTATQEVCHGTVRRMCRTNVPRCVSSTDAGYSGFW